MIETIEHIKDRGCKIEPAGLVDKAKFALIKSELLKGKDLVSVHKAVQNAELAEVMLVSRILHG